jgi:hypothetical protein
MVDDKSDKSVVLWSREISKTSKVVIVVMHELSISDSRLKNHDSIIN